MLFVGCICKYPRLDLMRHPDLFPVNPTINLPTVLCPQPCVGYLVVNGDVRINQKSSVNAKSILTIVAGSRPRVRHCVHLPHRQTYSHSPET